MYGQKTRFGQELPHVKPGVDYPINVHISGIHYRKEYFGSGQTEDIVYVNAVMNGKKVELRGNRDFPFQYYKLSPGDYQARLLKDPRKMGDTPIFQIYELLLPDRTVGKFTVTGISE
jgi:hypothetical protein